MSQIIITERHLIDGSSLRIILSDEISLSKSKYKVGLCWLNLASKLYGGGATKIFVASDSVNGIQHFNGKALIGSFKNSNSRSHFFCESPAPQIFGTLKNGNSIDLSLYNELNEVIPASCIDHLSICLVLLESAEMSHTMLSLSGEIENYTSSHDGLHYICRVELPQSVTFKPGSQIALTELYMPQLYDVAGRRLRKVKGDHNGGMFHCTVDCNSIAFDGSLGTRMLRSFCVKTGERHYAPPYMLFTKLSPGDYNTLEFTFNFKSCADLMRLEFRGRVEICVAITE